MIKDTFTKWEELNKLVKNDTKSAFLECYLSINSNNKLYFALNKDGKKTIFIEFPKHVLKNYNVPSISGMDIKKTDENFIDENCDYISISSNLDNEEVFYAFSSTLSENILDSRSDSKTIEKLEQTIKFYKDYFSNSKKTLSQIEEQGLCGELLYLKKLIVEMGQDVIKNWQGPFKNKRDFVFEKRAIEVKTTINQLETSITISNENQLDPSNLDELKLAVYVLERDENGPINVLNCIKDIDDIVVDVGLKKIFHSKIIALGVNVDSYEPKYCFTVQNLKTYTIDESFPSLKKGNIPSVVFNVSYKINLNSLDKYILKESNNG
ncbi:MAG: PD-(D/E)XK motif protein [Clostridia bacterium]|nr:PD-(D/E)XK motif protein [Clostridia bacterium]